jgi:predicted aldo/keto reductase-like oxidoreductase
MKNNNRRDFLKKSLVGLAGVSMLPASLGAKTSKPAETGLSGDLLPTRKLGKTGLDIPLISLGAGNSNNPQLVKAAYEAGIKLFFSATYYGEGNNEKMLGDALKDIPRDKILVGTAVIPKGIDHRAGLYTKESTYEELMKTAEGSLKRFGMDHVDILLLPYAAKRESVFFEPLLKAMQDLKKQGKTRFIGIASHSFSAEAVQAAVDTKVYDLAMPAYNFRSDKAMNDTLVNAAKVGFGIIAMKTQSGGFLDKERKQPVNSRAALKWVLQNENVSSVVSGMSKYEELQQNLSMLKDLKITPQELKDLQLAMNSDIPGLYCQQCMDCIPQCPHQVDIPSYMRSYMYAYGYRNLSLAQSCMNSLASVNSACNTCLECTVKCSVGFDVQSKIRDIARLKDVPSEFLMA